MQITCFHCQQTAEVPAKDLTGARLKLGLGFGDHTFVCPNCGTKNRIPAEDFEAGDHLPQQIPMTGTHQQDVMFGKEHEVHPGVAGKAPTNPVDGPDPTTQQRQAVVLAKSLDLHRGHNVHDEVMGNLKDGDRVTILGTWTNGEEFWVQLGPERWAPIEQDGQPLMELAGD